MAGLSYPMDRYLSHSSKSLLLNWRVQVKENQTVSGRCDKLQENSGMLGHASVSQVSVLLVR